MRYKDKELMDEIIECVDDFYIENLRSPYTAEIGEALGIAKSTVHRYLVEMDERNMLEYGRRRIVTPQIRKFSGDITRAGILGKRRLRRAGVCGGKLRGICHAARWRCSAREISSFSAHTATLWSRPESSRAIWWS